MELKRVLSKVSTRPSGPEAERGMGGREVEEEEEEEEDIVVVVFRVRGWERSSAIEEGGGYWLLLQ